MRPPAATGTVTGVITRAAFLRTASGQENLLCPGGRSLGLDSQLSDATAQRLVREGWVFTAYDMLLALDESVATVAALLEGSMPAGADLYAAVPGDPSASRVDLFSVRMRLTPAWGEALDWHTLAVAVPFHGRQALWDRGKIPWPVCDQMYITLDQALTGEPDARRAAALRIVTELHA